MRKKGGIFLFIFIFIPAAIVFWWEAPAAGRADRFNAGDRMFLTKAASRGLFIIEAAEMAEIKSDSNAVKDYASRLKHTHGVMNKDLGHLVAKELPPATHVHLPSHWDERHQKMIEEMADQEKTRFDQAFLKYMEQTHAEALKIYRFELESGDNSQIREFASSHMDTLAEHLETAERLRDRISP